MSGGVIRITMLASHVAGHVAGRSHYHKSSLLVPRAHRTPYWLGFYMSDDDDDDEPVLVTVL